MQKLLLIVCTLNLSLLSTAHPTTNQQLPIIDLGYTRHQALSYNDTYNYYTFSNIRYAKPPTGDLRFAAPVHPDVDRTSVQNGSESRICPQGVPLWQAKASKTIAKYKLGAPFTIQSWEADIANATTPNVTTTSTSTEDCLFLDVYVPPEVLQKSCDTQEGLKNGAAVLVWIFGGGYVLGSKTGIYNPSGLMKYGNLENGTGMIYVSLNYRLGALGFPSNETADEGGVLNAGLLDQRFALEWVQENIHLFGGDASRVTVMGESAGGGSVMLQMLAYNGTGKLLFAQAIPQSPATLPSFTEAPSSYTDLLAELNATSLADVRKLDSAQVIAANARVISKAPYTTYRYNPIFDNSFVAGPSKQVFDSGSVSKSIKVLTGLNSFEGSFFFDPTVRDESAFLHWLSVWLPSLPQSRLETIANTIYPPIFDGSQGYIDYDTRQMTVWGDGVFHCNAEMINNYFGANSYAYEFSVNPGIHTQDLSYTFDDPTLPGPLPALGARYTLQRAIASFTVHGTPYLYVNGSSQPTMAFPTWSPTARQVVNITNTGAGLGYRTLGGNATRCQWWWEGVYGLN